jgi:hypothetical protein
MAKTQLNLKLIYKGILLDTIKQDAEFKQKWTIGSDKFLFWQILDPAFPARHSLLQHHGKEVLMRLLPGVNITCSKNGSPVDADFLQKNGILTGTQLHLRPDMSGTIRWNQNWEIAYEYTEPQIRILTEEQRKEVAKYTRLGQMTGVERLNRGLILLTLILGLAFILLYDLVLKPEAINKATLAEKLAAMENAQRIEPQFGQATPLPTEESLTAEQKQLKDRQAELDKAKNKGKTDGKQTNKTSSQPANLTNAQSTFGNYRSGSSNPAGTGPVAQTTYYKNFVVAAPGGKNGSTGPNGGVAPSFDVNGNLIGGASSGFASTFDPNATANYNYTTPNRITTNKPPSGGSTKPPAGSTNIRIINEPTQLKPLSQGNSPTPDAVQTNKITSDVRPPDVVRPTEPEVKINPSYTGGTAANNDIYNKILARKNQIKQIYTKHDAQKHQSGSITVRMYIEQDGSVSAEVTPNGNFSSDFVSEIKSIVENWRIPVNKKSIYEFKMQFSRA